MAVMSLHEFIGLGKRYRDDAQPVRLLLDHHGPPCVSERLFLTELGLVAGEVRWPIRGPTGEWLAVTRLCRVLSRGLPSDAAAVTARTSGERLPTALAVPDTATGAEGFSDRVWNRLRQQWSHQQVAVGHRVRLDRHCTTSAVSGGFADTCLGQEDDANWPHDDEL